MTAVARKYPALAKYFRVHDVTALMDLLQRLRWAQLLNALMMRLSLFFGVFLVISGFIACKGKEDSPLVVHVLRDPSAPFSKSLSQADLQFGLTKPHLSSGRGVMVGTNAGSGSFSMLLQRLGDQHGEDLVILNSPSDLPASATIRNQLGKQRLICGGAGAYIPDWVSGESRDATEMYLQYLGSHCEGGTSP